MDRFGIFHRSLDATYPLVLRRPFFPDFLVFALLAAVSAILYGPYIGIRRSRGLLLWLVSFVAGVFVAAHGGSAWAGMVVMLAVPFAGRLHQKWLGGKMTEQERAPGRAGLRAWLRPVNLLLCALISFCAWQGLGYSFWAVLAVTVGALAAGPLIRMLLQAEPAQASPKPGLSPEREKILKLLEEGKVSSEEAGELLRVLEETAAPGAGQAVPMTAGRRLILGGAVLVLIGFLLPWFHYGSRTGRFHALSPIHDGDSLTVTGAHAGDWLGWAVLLLSAGVAVLPHLAGGIRPAVQRSWSLVGLGIGAVILIYLFTEGISGVSVGLLAAMAGYAFQFAGVFRDRGAGAAG